MLRDTVELATESVLEDGNETGFLGSIFERMEKRAKGIVDGFLDDDNRAQEAIVFPRYYGELLAWAVDSVLKLKGAEIKRVIGYFSTEPIYTEVNTDYTEKQNILADGRILAEIDRVKIVLSVSIDYSGLNVATLESTKENEAVITRLAEEIEGYAKNNNFYRGKRLELRSGIKMVCLKEKPWDDVVIDEEIKKELCKNTVGFINNIKLWEELGIPPKRGVLLEGEPGTGKTIICKALMTEASGITCINANAYAINRPGYIEEIFEAAEDLAPCLLFIEDIDMVGQTRARPGSGSNPILASLLGAMDGIEQKAQVLTIATTNCLDSLDKALSERPSHFDRIIKIGLPDKEQRRTIITRLREKIKLDEAGQEYLAGCSDGLTPAQIQEVVFTLAIEHEEPEKCREEFSASARTLEKTVQKIKNKNSTGLGFKHKNNGSF
jgi:cell division protease FtsH